MKYEINITAINPPLYIVPSDRQICGSDPMPQVKMENPELIYTRTINTENIGSVLKGIEDNHE
jgi:hypothetical protein